MAKVGNYRGPRGGELTWSLTAKLKIQEEIISGTFQLIWSYILDYENNRNPYQERKLRIKKWKRYAIEDVEENPVVIETAKILNKKGFHKIDSLHIACAIISKSEYFLTTDDQILKRARLLTRIMQQPSLPKMRGGRHADVLLYFKCLTTKQIW